MSGVSAEVAPRRWGGVPEALDELTAGRATGAVHVEGGSIYLLDGEIYYVQTPAAPGVDCLLQASGTVPPSVFQTAWTAGAAAGQVGEVLVKSGALSRGEAELCTATAIADGAFALFMAPPGEVRFAPGEGHWWGALRRVAPAALEAQVRKRRRLLERTPPGDADDQPVVAAGRLGRHHVVLTDLQWELVVHADGRRTPRELARLLGRSAFSAVLETRRLITAGLIRVVAAPPLNLPPAHAAPSRAVPPYAAPPYVPALPVDPGPPAAATSSPPAISPPPEASQSSGPSSSGSSSSGSPSADGPAEATRPLPVRRPAHSAPLPRRQPGAALRGVVPVGPQPGVPSGSVLDVPEPDTGLLSRVRNALEGLR
ncbi:DUF4388 domain-containing protein [Cryptosporangium phraense]|uniref:PatA-like N-terminal domain-containing protein n=1 Tax=Cryptosporangium phraense TaxID=2593070 RepID=A0A545AYA4_9ACTN|nr:DUF4388 domain-containing protein [Cryptosporangium phraense]TQS46314.1 hypothetical protein FL583_02655 [Cryptosporangium phraense]